jgi:hypothetical protein
MLKPDHDTVKNELGMVICKICNDVIYTLPTNGLKKFYSVCGKEKCVEKTREGDRN